MWRGYGLTIHYPSRWFRTRYNGPPATVVDPMIYLSERHLGGPCPPLGQGPSNRPGPTSCFNGSWRVPDDATIIRWVLVEIPSPTSYAVQPGRHVRIDGRRAKIFMSSARCDSGGPGTLISAAITLAHWSVEFGYIDMDACIGRHAPRGDIDAVKTMLRTAKVSGG